MDELKKLMDSLGLEKQLSVNEMPGVDLYMDQVIQLFENKYGDTKRYEDEKILTKTMINNYAKGKLFFPVKKKKYTRDHLIMISLIYQLKGALSINDIKGVLDGVNTQAVSGELDLEAFYSAYLEICTKNNAGFTNELEKRAEVVDLLCDSGNSEEDNRIVLLIASLVHMSNMYRRVAEKLADQLRENTHSEENE
ncbi:hypothetical protein A8F94_18040 [Bacillus sp. FJAT-27225]|uniref:DUF1836 domain-containing protein n=1 Tax=Bacillus sp. FJAT-27225 TaxID=1743144 RepID=UPI00080C2415|nr:DUF1836 domain-containing protein [Bacillus sp. FJAT-27225]OCA83044.1 hypothetical protein A8F94_18040 [Bacillus sp. FJAT-27225]